MNKYQIKRLLKIFILLLFILITYYYKDNIYKPNKLKDNENTIQNKEETKVISNDLEIHFLDVGEADCALICSNGEYALIDAGNTIDGNKIVKYFESLGITDFKYLFGTHAHEDHIGGLANVIYNFNIGKVYMPNVPSEYKSYHNVIKALNKKNSELNNPINDEEYKLGESTLKIIYNGENEEDINNSSLIIKLTYKNKSFLFTGDTTKEIEDKILDKDLNSNLLKVSHHGSNDASSANFLVKVHPEYAIISVGKDNDYHHPHQVTIDKLERLGTKVYRTDQDGTIIVKSDGESINIETIKTDTNKEE